MTMNVKEILPIGCVVMAAGNAHRFGENKLAAAVDGKSLIRRALDVVPADRLSAVCVVTQYDEVENLAREYGFRCVRNRHPEWGLSERTAPLGPEWMAAAVAGSPKWDPKKIFVMARCFGGDCTMENCTHCELTSADTPDELADFEALAAFIAANEELFLKRWPYLSPVYKDDD